MAKATDMKMSPACKKAAKEAGLNPNDKRLVTGLLSVHPRQFGFLRLDEGGKDLFVPPPAVSGHLDGDYVLYLNDEENPSILLLIERSRSLASGVYERKNRICADDPKLPSPLHVQCGRLRPKFGDKVLVSLEKHPYRLIKNFGPAQAPGIEEKAALAVAEIAEKFPKAVMDEVKKFKEPSARDFKGRVDLRDSVSIVTIDPVSSRDFDDAISVTKTPRGFDLGVHIADVSAFVKPGSALDREAQRRCQSVYLTSRVIPMLPEKLSADLCSLREGRERLTKSVLFSFDEFGRQRSVKVCRSVIRPFKRLTYGRASEVMEGKGGEHPSVTETLRAMCHLAQLLRGRRENAFSLHRPEVEFVYDASGQMVGVKEAATDVAHGVVEEFMLAANQAVGDFLFEAEKETLWRHHAEPANLDDFCAFTQRLGLPYLPQHSLARYMDKVAKRTEARLIFQEFLWALPPAEYSTKRMSHFGLAMERYLHFTSPIRRYADLVVHRAVEEVLGLKRKGPRFDLERLAERISARERVVNSAESRMRRMKILDFLDKQDRGPHEGVITQMTKSGLKVELTRLLIWGMLPFESLPGGDWVSDEMSVQNEEFLYRLGDKIHVRVEKIDRRSGHIIFSR